VIGVINPIANSPNILLALKNTDGSTYKIYMATKQTPKAVCNLTADLAYIRPGEVIKFAKFDESTTLPYARSQADFFQEGMGLLNHVYISYSYKY
jgi:hypothetical protein